MNYKSYYLKSLGFSEDILPGGKGDNIQSSKIDPNQLEMGIKVEMEHTHDPALAKEIALDHLTEDPQYYDKLKGAGLADELDKTSIQGSSFSKLLSPTAIMPQIIGVTIRGTKSGGLPAGGRVDNPEKSAMGGFEKVTLTKLPQGGIKSNSENARLGGLERVQNLKPNSQGTFEDTPISPEIKANRGHFTPDTPEITKKEAPVTNVKGDEAIHPFQVQQLGNPPFEDDGTGSEDKSSKEKTHPEVGPWGIDLDDKEDETASSMNIDIRETLQAAKETSKHPVDRSLSNVKDHEKKMYDDLRDGGDSHSEAINTIKGERMMGSYLHREGKINESDSPDIKQRFQKLANIKVKNESSLSEPEVQTLMELRALVNKRKMQGKISEIVLKADKYLSERGL